MQTASPYPLVFEPFVRSAPWGEERWLASGLPEHPSVVANGAFAGLPLPDVCRALGPALLGSRAADAGTLPLIVKDITADEALSLQLHPDARAAEAVGGEAKTEAWHVLSAAPGASIFAGWKDGVGIDDVRAALGGAAIAELVERLPVSAKDTFLLPGGVVHALGGGLRVLEAQQCSDTTYRLYDWGRKGPDGKCRELHLEKALRCMEVSGVDVRPVRCQDGNVSCGYFTIGTTQLSAAADFPADGLSFRMLFATGGKVAVASDGFPETVLEESAVFLPASVSASARPLSGGARLVTVSM